MSYVSLAQMGGVTPSTALYPKRMALDVLSMYDGQANGTTFTQGVSQQTWPTADLACYYPLRVKETCIAYKFWFAPGAVGTDNIDMGLYRRSGAKIISTGLTAKVASSTCQVVDITDTVLVPDLYYIGFTCVSATATFTMQGLGNIPMMQSQGVRTEQLTGPNAPLPATATWVVPAAATTFRVVRCGITAEVTVA